MYGCSGYFLVLFVGMHRCAFVYTELKTVFHLGFWGLMQPPHDMLMCVFMNILLDTTIVHNVYLLVI